MTTCGAVFCAVAFFIGFMVLSDMIENATAIENDDQLSSSSTGVVYGGRFSVRVDGSGGDIGPVIKDGKCQMRAISRQTGAADMSLASVDIRFRDEETGDSEIFLKSGLLIKKDDVTHEYFGKGHTFPFMFDIIESASPCELDTVNLTFVETAPGTSFDDDKLTTSKSFGVLKSSKCKFSVEFDLVQINLNRLKRKIVNYSIFNNALTLALIKLYIDQIRIVDSNSTYARISMASIIMQSITDSLDSMINFFTGLSIQFLFNIFIIISLFKFILFSFFEMRLIILTWRTVNHQLIATMDPYDSARIERNWIQSRLYLPLIGALVLLLVYPQLSIVPLVIVSQLYWIPQIVLDAVKGHKSSLSIKFILGVSICRLMLPLYTWGCPDSIFNGEVIPAVPGPSGFVVTILIFVQLVQVGLMLSQKRFGPRWFVPWMFLPNVYNYYRRIDLDEEFGVPECVVCMAEIDLKQGRKNTVITPCGHLFHGECLQQWIDVGKMECPICRRELPPIT